MNERTTVPDTSVADKAKIAVTILLALGGIVAYYLLASQAAWMRWLAVVGGIVLGVVVFATSRQGHAFKQFVIDSRVELRKIVWPGRQETLTTTAVVFGFVVIAGVFFWALDLVLAWATRALTGQGGG
jgi:preprotein translocase subunit SecE